MSTFTSFRFLFYEIVRTARNLNIHFFSNFRAVAHDKVPENSGTVRVKEYWSVMHIKAVKGLNDVR